LVEGAAQETDEKSMLPSITIWAPPAGKLRREGRKEREWRRAG
jgi:hypothetical protein